MDDLRLQERGLGLLLLRLRGEYISLVRNPSIVYRKSLRDSLAVSGVAARVFVYGVWVEYLSGSSSRQQLEHAGPDDIGALADLEQLEQLSRDPCSLEFHTT